MSEDQNKYPLDSTDRQNDIPLETTKDETESKPIEEETKENIRENFLSFDKILEKISFGIYQLRIYSIIGLLSVSEGAQVMIFTLMIPILEREWEIPPYITNIQMSVILFFSMVGSLISGKISDKIGRKSPISFCSYLLLCVTVFSAFSPNIYVLIFFRAALALLLGFLVPIGSSMIAEITPVHMRGRYMSTLGYSFSIGHIFGLLSAYAVLESLKNGNWRTLILVCSFPGLIACSLLHVYFDESPRYLLMNGKEVQGFEVIEKMIDANSNGQSKKLSEKQKEKLLEWVDLICQTHEETKNASFFSLFSRKLRKITLITWWNWFSSNFIYFGIVVFMPKIIDEIQGTTSRQSIFLILLSTIAEFISVTITTMVIDSNGFGRKNSLIIFSFLTSIVSIIVYTDTPQHFIVWASVAKLFTNMTSSIISSFTLEIYSTKIRSTGFGIANAIGKMGGIAMPWIAYRLIEYDLKAPFLCFMALGFISTIFSWWIPFDTMGIELDHF